MLYNIIIGLILVACVLLILAVLVQSPKGGMAANFGASNQVMGVRQTTDFLEKFTWVMAISILVLSLLATVALGSGSSKSSVMKDSDALLRDQMNSIEAPLPQVELPAEVEAEQVAE